MNFYPTEIPGVVEIDLFNTNDERGSFVKTFHFDSFKNEGLETDFKESFYSTNRAGVIRGMHFQLPPNDHAKLVYVTQGKVLDVALDLRKDSKTFGSYFQIELSGSNHKALYMPSGIAHGFYCISDATMIYLTSTVHNPDSDSGIRWDSFGFNWPVNNPIISKRDCGLPLFREFNSPFTLK